MSTKVAIIPPMHKRPFKRPYAWAILALCLFCACIRATPAFPQDNDERELFLVAQKAFEDGFYDVAIRYIDQLFQEYPQTEKRIQAKLLLGQCYFFQSQYLKAYDTFQSLLEHTEFKDATLFWLGETYLKGSDYKKANEQYRQLISLFPESEYAPQAYYSLGWSYFVQQDLKKAKEIFTQFLRTFPAHQLAEDTAFKLAEVEYNLRDYEQAIQRFQNYAAKYPQSRNHAQAFFYIAESYYYLEDYLTAVTYYAKSAEISYDNKLVLMSKVSLGWSYLKLEKFKIAQTYFDDAFKFAQEKNILSDDVYLGQATFYAEIGNLEKARDAYTDLIANFPKSERIVEAYLGLANTHYQGKNYRDAIKTYQKIIERAADAPLPPEIAEKTYFGLAWAQLKGGDVDAAIKSFQTIKDSTESKTVKISALTQIGDAYQDIEQYEKAVGVYDKILSEFPDSPYTDYVQYRQGIALLKMDKIEAATLSFQTLKTNFPLSKYINDINYYLAVAYFKKDDWPVAKEYIHEFIAGLPQADKFRAEASYILALSHFNLREYQESLTVLFNIIKDFPSETAMVRNAELYIAKCNYKMGAVGEAIKKFQTLVGKYPKSKTAHDALLWLGDHYLEASDFDNAILHYEKLIREFPGSDRIDLVYFDLGRAYEAKEEYDHAVNAFKRVSDGKDREVYAKAKIAIADIFSRDLDPQSAIETYQNIIDTSPEFKRDALAKIAEVHKGAKNYPETISAYREALKADRTTNEHSDAELQFLMADSYQLNHQHERAVEEYLRIPYLYPHEVNWVIKANLRTARIFEDNERWDDAKITYTKILKFQTDEAKFAQERLDWINEHIP